MQHETISWSSFRRESNKMQTFVLLSSTTVSFAVCLFVVFSLAHRNGVVLAQLRGDRETCDAEGEPVLIDIPNVKCIDCACKNGFVHCEKRKCPNIEGCYRSQDVKEDDCCHDCKGCKMNSLSYESGEEWTDKKDPCKRFTCTDGVITETVIRCHLPCKSQIPPKPGQCCPTCRGCRINGKTIIEGTHSTPTGDPCLTCTCVSDNLLCTRKTCPVLNCPKQRMSEESQQCCPKCLGTAKYMDPPNGACLFLPNSSIHQPGSKFTLDNCTQCNCRDSTLHCERSSCPSLKCKPEHREMQPGQCCARCKNRIEKIEAEEAHAKDDLVDDKDDFSNEDHGDVDGEPHGDDTEDQSEYDRDDNGEKTVKDDKRGKYGRRSCSYRNKSYKHGEKWNTDKCETCTCSQSEVKCAPIMCPAINCPPNSSLKIPKGQCCPICEESPGVCSVYGGSHFRTFDEKLFAFIGSCKYQLVSDCESGTFSIRLKNNSTGNDVMVKRISMKFRNVRVDFQQNKNTKVNDRVIDLPYKLKNQLEINGSKEDLVVVTKLGVKVQWNYEGFLEVTVPKSYRRKLCGLCGNFDSIADNDLTTREGILVDDPTILAQSWTAGDDICFDNRRYGIKGCNPQSDQRLCSYIKGSVFERCLKKINVSSYYETCLKEMCECPPGDKKCHCEAFASYVRDCGRLGISLPDWETAVGC